MGIKLINEIMDFAPRMTATEWKAMIILAEDANDGTRQTWSIVTGEKIMRRMDLTPAAAKNLRGVLVRKGLLEVSVAGRRGRAAKYRFPDFRAMGHGSHDSSVPLGHESHDETAEPDVAEASNGHEFHAETAPMGHGFDEATAEWVMGSVPPTPQEHSSEQNTPQNLSLAQPQQRASPFADPTNERETIREEEAEPQPEEPQARPQEQRPAQEVNGADVIDAYVQARRDGGQPATATERVRLRAAVVELADEGHTFEYLIRLVDWMGRAHPDWTNLARARTAPGAPALIPGQRAADRDDSNPCLKDDCGSCQHEACDRGWIENAKGGLVRCPCWPEPTAYGKPAGHQTFQQPTDMSIYYDPKTKPDHVGWKNPTDPDAYEGTF